MLYDLTGSGKYGDIQTESTYIYACGQDKNESPTKILTRITNLFTVGSRKHRKHRNCFGKSTPTNGHSAQSSLVVTHPSTNRCRRE